MNRISLARLLNLIAPGTGLIVLGRAWHGLALTTLFVICGQVALLGWWVIPWNIPVWLARLAAVGAGLIWGLAQWTLQRAWRASAPPEAVQ